MTVQFKLTMGSIAVILVMNSVLSFVIVEYLAHVWLNEVQTRVRLNLNSARAAYDNHVNGIATFLRAAALNRGLAAALRKKDRDELGRILQDVYRTAKIDFVGALDDRGQVICRPRNPRRKGDDLSQNPIVAKILQDRKPASGTILLARESLENEGADLAERARFELIETPAARPTDEPERTDGLVLAAAVPVLDAQGRLLGVLYGGDLLNRQEEIVNSIKEEVFPPRVFQGKEIGTVTIFQGDLRVSTNVTRADGSRAIGTRLSAEVCDEVLVRGGVWAAPAFVVNDWYITAYEPICDPRGDIVGVLYVGLLQAAYTHTRNVIAGVFLAMVGATTLASLLLLFFVSRLVLDPMSRIVSMTRHVIEGDLSARVGIRPPGEMGVLCQAIDSMAEAIAQREEQLKLATRRQIGRSEQLASIGRLAAGVAHEINNPLTGVLTFAHLLRQRQSLTEQDRQDANLIVHGATRAAEIVRSLLDFARERPAVKELLEINEVIRRTLRLIRNQQSVKRVFVVEDLGEDLPKVNGDLNQLQQVILNLALNACEAMPQGGTLLITTAAQDGKVLVKLTDTGGGIKREHLDLIFEPFFSTKPVGKGTGLGLSVSYGIIQQHAGAIEVESAEGKGSTFTVVLPSAS